MNVKATPKIVPAKSNEGQEEKAPELPIIKRESRLTRPAVPEARPIEKVKLPEINIQEEPHDKLTPMTPDMHTGRVFTNLLPKQGEIILPIRGERVIDTSEEKEIQEDINEKAEELKSLLNKIKQDEKIEMDSEGQLIRQDVSLLCGQPIRWARDGLRPKPLKGLKEEF